MVPLRKFYKKNESLILQPVFVDFKKVISLFKAHKK
jgi:hypothetical protein